MCLCVSMCVCVCVCVCVCTDMSPCTLIYIPHILSPYSDSPIILSSLISTDLASELDNAETQAAERELALSSTVTVFNSKIDCLEKILEESQIMKMRSEADFSSHLANFQGKTHHCA